MEKCDRDVSVAFYFPQFDNQESLTAEAAFSSIIRQTLDPQNLSKGVEALLRKMEPSQGLGELLDLLRARIAESRVFYIAIDGLDEFEKPERHDILRALSTLTSNESRIRLFLASRESLAAEIRTRFPSLQHVSMGSPSVHSDIKNYVEGIIQEKLGKDLIIGDQCLVEQIKQALVKGADGM